MILYKLKIAKHYIKSKLNQKILNEKNLNDFQDKMVKKHLKYVVKNSSFFREKVDKLNPELKDFPIIDKSVMMENFDEFCTVDIDKEKAFEIAIDSEKSREFSKDYKNITVALSSGTSGNRGMAIADEFDRTLWTGRILSKMLPRTILTKEKIAFFLRANNNVYKSLNSSKILFEYFDLMKNVDENILKLEKYNPTIITAPSSMLLLIAKAIEDEKIVINPVKVISVAEVLEDNDKKYLEEIFSQNIHQIYQATEGFLGYTCSHGVIHINEDMVKIEKEYIDKEAGKFIPIITDFRRRSQPIIRYRLNDILVEKKERCKCGSCFMAIDRIEGREDDIFYFETADGTVPMFPDFISRAVIYSSENIKSYYVSQTKKNNINIYISLKNKNELEKIKKDIKSNFLDLKEKMNIEEMNIKFEDNYYLEKGRKMKRIERLYK